MYKGIQSARLTRRRRHRRMRTYVCVPAPTLLRPVHRKKMVPCWHPKHVPSVLPVSRRLRAWLSTAAALIPPHS